MSNKYVDFISDDHYLKCIGILYNSYSKAKTNLSKKSFYKNKIDSFKLIFDSEFNNVDDKTFIQSEINRQIDKSINNSIGTFHENIMSGIKGFELGNNSGYDIKANDNSMFADIKNKYNTINSSSAEALFQKLSRFADSNKHANCFWVQILAKSSFNELWKGEINGKEYSHSRVYKISGDQFYKLLTGNNNAFFDLYKSLPNAINDYLNSISSEENKTRSSTFDEISSEAEEAHRTIIDQITFDNYKYYLGFDEL